MTVAKSHNYPYDWGIISYMVGVHLIALLAFFPAFFSWKAVGVMLFLYWVTACLGITVGFHRMGAHRSFQAPKWLEYFFILCGSLACQGGPLDWIGLHRIHHKYSDTSEDPHDSNEGFWWSHLGWMMYRIPASEDIPRYTQDISKDPFYLFCQNYFVLIQVALGLLLFAIGGWPFVIWGIFVRLVVVFHVTWLVNSATHKFGYVSHQSDDNSRNCWWVALLSFGEGWHNNHHAYQFSARHGLQWWEIDVTWMIIRSLEMLGLVTNVKLAPTTRE
jgi:stearoyl-CoA desaturase (delta-9 desaturase)